MPIILDEIDRLAGDLGHVECPEHTSDGQPDLTLCDDHARTDAAPGEGDICQLGCNRGGRRGGKWGCGDIPSSKGPVIALVRVGQLGAVC